MAQQLAAEEIEHYDPEPVAMVKVRLTMHPDRDTEVPADEVPVLRSQGLLIEDEAKPAAKPAAKSGASGAKEGA